MCLKEFCIELIDEDEILTKENCMLSNFKNKLLVLISTIVKHRIFISRINKWPISYGDVLDRIKAERNRQESVVTKKTRANYMRFWGCLIHDVVFETRQLRKT